MVDYVDSSLFTTEWYDLEKVDEPALEDFADTDSLKLVNISGELRLYSNDGAKVQYQTFTLSAKVDV